MIPSRGLNNASWNQKWGSSLRLLRSSVIMSWRDVMASLEMCLSLWEAACVDNHHYHHHHHHHQFFIFKRETCNVFCFHNKLNFFKMRGNTRNPKNGWPRGFLSVAPNLSFLRIGYKGWNLASLAFAVIKRTSVTTTVMRKGSWTILLLSDLIHCSPVSGCQLFWVHPWSWGIKANFVSLTICLW